MSAHHEVSDRSRGENAQVAKFQNSYRLESQNPFNVGSVETIIEEVMSTNLGNASYDSTQCPKLCIDVASEIRKQIKELKFDRYRIVVVMTIIEKASQAFNASLGFLWDTQRDNFATYTFESHSFYACCHVFGVYYE